MMNSKYVIEYAQSMQGDNHNTISEQDTNTVSNHGMNVVPQQYVLQNKPTDFLQWGFILLFIAVLFGSIDDFIDPPELDEGESYANWIDDLESYDDIMGLFNSLSAIVSQIGFLLIAMTLMKRGFEYNSYYSDSLRMAMIIASALILMHVSFPGASTWSLAEIFGQGLLDPY